MKKKAFRTVGMIRRTISLLLLFSLLFCSFAEAGNEPVKLTNSDGYVYIIKDDDTAEIVGYAGQGGELEIPSEIDGHTVTSLGKKAFAYNNALLKVVVPGTVTSIGEACFVASNSLDTIVLNEGLQHLDGSFAYLCAGLRHVNIPDSVTSIGECLFAGSRNLEDVVLSENHPVLRYEDGVIFTRENPTLLWYPAAKKDQVYAVPEGTVKIGFRSFYFTQVEKVILPESVETIADQAFCYGDQLREINIPAKVSVIEGAFGGCSKLESIEVDARNETFESIDGVLINKTDHGLIVYPVGKADRTYEIPEGIEVLYSGAFENCALAEVKFPSTLKDISYSAFYGSTGLKKAELPEGLEHLRNYAFAQCYALKEVTIPYSLKDIKQNPFMSCDQVPKIILPEDHEYLLLVNDALIRKSDMFMCCVFLKRGTKSYTVPDGVKKIGWDVFLNPSSLNELILPEGLEEIDDFAFRGCDKLQRVVFPESLAKVGKSVFYENTPDTTFIVKKGSFAENYCQSYGLKYESQ